jgi:uncharacterized membrane protein YeaQ/YmgE (transglycosylase-associated protein family)
LNGINFKNKQISVGKLGKFDCAGEAPPLFHRLAKFCLGDARVKMVLGGINMSGESILVILLVGLVAGWLAGQLVRGSGFGLVGDIIIGIIGAFIGDWLLPQLGLHFSAGILGAIIDATIGAILLLLVLRLIRGGRGRRGRRW